MRFIDLKTQYEEMKEDINSGIQRVLDHGQYILGPEHKQCEEDLAKFLDVKHALCCGNGTDALILALMALDIKAGDEVIVPAFTFFASAEVISFVGAKPIFIDVEEDTCNLNVSLIEQAITKNTKAIIAVGLFGQAADMDEINSLGEKHNLHIIEDAAQSFGAKYKDRKSSALGKISCTSFFPAKPLGCYGDGGAVFTNDPKLNQIMFELRMHGESSRYNHSRVGMNARMDTLQCAVIIEKLKRYPKEIEMRTKVANYYKENLQGIDEVQVLTLKDDRSSVYAQFTIKVQKRDKLREFLQTKDIPTAVHYPKPVHKQACYLMDYEGQSLPVSEALCDMVMSLPMHPYLKTDEQDIVINGIKEFYK